MAASWIARLSSKWILHLSLSINVVVCLFPLWVLSAQAQIRPSPLTPFVIRSYLSSTFPGSGYPGKCLQFGSAFKGVGPTVFISDCNGSASQTFDVEDVAIPVRPSGFGASMHKAILHAGSKCVGALSKVIAAGIPLVVTNCSDALLVRLDGDSMIVDSDHGYVAKVKDAVTANATPVVLGSRQVSDDEFWTFSAADGSTKRPTAAFVSAADLPHLASELRNALPGTVIEITSSPTGQYISPMSGSTCSGLFQVPAGVTIRGDRRGTLEGPWIAFNGNPKQTSLFEIMGDDVRITGLRLQGPSRELSGDALSVRGVCSESHSGLIVDHNDLSNWTRAAVDLNDGDPDNKQCPTNPELNRHPSVLITRNFIHHNEQQSGGGYGVASGSGAYPSIEANTFLVNRHSITGDGSSLTAYSAWFNLELSDAPYYGWHKIEQDFDMHGQGEDNHMGGIAGSNLEIARNTFLGTNRPNLELRGFPCTLAQFHDNIFRLDQSDNEAILWYVPTIRDRYGNVVSCTYRGDPICGFGNPPVSLALSNNTFGVKDPTQKLGVGDFDGDGKDDLFLATGEAWYYSPDGNAEWRFLSAKTETIDNLLFGDFDGDGHTDVFTQIGNDWMVSWGGISPWEKINSSQWRMTDFFIGDFVGDRRADVFFARGDQWFVSDAGRGPFVPFATSKYKVSELRFGDFDGDKKMDVVGVVDHQYQVVFAKPDALGHRVWRPLRPASPNVGFIVADFDGDGISDIAELALLRFYPDGTGSPVAMSPALFFPHEDFVPVAVGNFDDHPGADILLWDSRSLKIISSGRGSPVLQSRQDMR